MEKNLVTKENRICHILKCHFSSSIVTAIRQGGKVFLNGQQTETFEFARQGDILEVELSEKSSVEGTFGHLDIVFEDEEVLLVNKPGGLNCHPSRSESTHTLLNFALFHTGEQCKLHIITRLDKGTKGLVLIGKNHFSASFLGNEMRKREIFKTYHAICHGTCESEFVATGKIARLTEGKPQRGVCENGQEAETLFIPLKRENGKTLFKVIPKTGRTHQIRVHASFHGFPIVGDKMYGTLDEFEEMGLFMTSISFKHPKTKELLTFEIPVAWSTL